MQCTSPCSTSSTGAGWSSSRTLVAVCEGLSQREPITFQPSRLRGDKLRRSLMRDEGLKLRICVSRRHCDGSARSISCSVSRGRSKNIRDFALLAAAVGVSVEFETENVAVADSFAGPSSRALPLSPAWSAHLVAEESARNDRIAAGRSQVLLEQRVDRRDGAWDDGEVRSIVVDFLESRGLSQTLSLVAVQKAPTFISHILSILQSCYPARYLSGKELTRSEIRCVALPFMASLAAIQSMGVDRLFGDFSSAPDLASFVPLPGYTNRILAAYPLLRGRLKDGKLPPSLFYCLSIGLKPTQVEAALKKFPPIGGYSVEGKIERVVDFILSLDVSSSLIPAIVLKRPQLFGCSVEDNLRPSLLFLEQLGVERTRWGRILVAFPHMLTYSSAKSNLVFNFLLDCGVSYPAAGKVLSRFPHAVGYSVELKLKPLAAYFHSLGIEDFSRVITRSPQTLGLSLEHNIKPTVEFFRSTLGLSVEEIALVLNRFPQILGLNVEHNLQPKWKFFLGMNRCKTQLVDFPQYFGYSLEKRILPRYKIVVEKQIQWTLNRMLSTSKELFFRLTKSNY